MNSYFTQLDDPKAADAQFKESIKVLQLLEAVLSPPSGAQDFLCGEKASHADAVIFGWYAFHKRNEPVSATKIWESDELPGVRAWVGRVRERFANAEGL